MSHKIQISTVKNLNNALVIKKYGDTNFFVTTPDSIIIKSQDFSVLLYNLVMGEFLHHGILEGILEDYHSNREVYTKERRKQIEEEGSSFD